MKGKIGILLRKKEGKEETFTPIKGLQRRTVLLVFNYTNEKIAQGLKEEGVPLIEHKDFEESKTKSLRDKVYHSWQVGEKMNTMLSHHKIKDERRAYYIIEGTGQAIVQRQGIKLRADELVEALKTMTGRRLFLRTYHRFTDMAIQRMRMIKFKTQLFSIPQDRVTLSKKWVIEADQLPANFKKLIDASFWLGGIFDNIGENSIAIELTGRQPGAEATHQLLFKIE